MGYLDEEILETRRQFRRQEHTTLETEMYAGEELITFTCSKIFDSHVCIPLPDQFVMMPEGMKNIKYPSRKGNWRRWPASIKMRCRVYILQ